MQGPINPPYQTACFLKKNSLLATQKPVSNTSEVRDKYEHSDSKPLQEKDLLNNLQKKDEPDQDEEDTFKSSIATALYN